MALILILDKWIDIFVIKVFVSRQNAPLVDSKQGGNEN